MPVAVIGAGLGGTAAAAFLARAGVAATVLERRATPSDRPRARMVSARSMELFRELGLADDVLTLGEAGSYEIHVVDTFADALAGPREPDQTAAVSPTGAALLDQDLLEGLLRDYAEKHGATFRWGAEVSGIDDHDTAGEGCGVTLRLADGGAVVASYALLAEGGRAGLRDALGIASLTGQDSEQFTEVLFRSQGLDELMRDRPGAGFVSTATGSNLLRRDARRWTLTRYVEPITDPVADLAAAAGRPLDVDVLSEGSWRPSAALATTFRTGNVFLVGDVAHAMPPSVGMAGNLAVADAHNLAWKLALVLRGEAGPRLLDSYGAERRPAATVVLDEALQSLHTEPEAPLPTPVLQLGIGYPPARSSALLSAEFEQPLVDPASLAPRIGARLPHRWLENGRSTVDLTGGTDFVTVGPRAADTSPLRHHVIDTGTPEDDRVWLVRPDGHVAAHVRPAEIPEALDRLLDRAEH